VIEQVGIDAGRLRRAVATQTQRAAADLVNQLEGLQVQLATGARQQRFQVFQQRRDDQFEAAAARPVEQAASKLFDASGLGGQDIGDVLGQEPSREHEKRTGVENGILPARTRQPACNRPSFQRHSTSSSTPASMLLRPMKRIWPSLMRMARSNTCRHAWG
jgi:hypothetical protein